MRTATKEFLAAVVIMAAFTPGILEAEGVKGGVYMNGRQIGGPVIMETAPADAAFHANRGARGIPMPDKSSDTALQTMIQETAGKFQTFTYVDKETGLSVPYSLYLPKGYDSAKAYPMIVFIADASVVGKEVDAPLRQGYGGIIWATAEEQAKHECLILIPEYPGVIIDDHGEHTTTAYVPLTERLIRSVAEEYSVDKDRIYATGQSMGCMTLMVLAARHPDLFAAGLFVSGQWDVNELGGLENQTFFYVTAEGDDKASTGQRELMEKFQRDGIPFTRSFGWDARMSQENFAESVASALSEKRAANFVQFRLGTVLPEGMDPGVPEHMFSFDFAYKIDVLRDWLFEQRLKR